MRDAVLRAKKDKLLVLLVERYLGSIHPNAISVAALGVGLLAAAAVVGNFLWLGLLLWLLNRVLDGLDGLVARVHHKQSDFGGYLDLLLDYVIYLAIPLAFVAVAPSPLTLWAGLALLSSYILNVMSWTVLSALLEKRQLADRRRLTGIEMPAGLIEGAETILFYVALFLLPEQTAAIMLVLAALVLVTVVQRVFWAYRQFEG